MNRITILAVFAILAVAAVFTATGSTMVGSITAQTTDNATMAGNMTGMGAGNMTADNATGSISGHR